MCYSKWKSIWPVSLVAGIFALGVVVASASGEEETATAPREGAAPVAVIAPDSAFTAVEDVRRGQRVTLRGEVVALADEDEFILADETGRIRVYIGWRNDMPVDVGEVVTVVGMADDDVVPGMRPEIYARTLILENEAVVDLRTGRVLSKDEAAQAERPAPRARGRAVVEADEPAPQTTAQARSRRESPVIPINEVRRGQRVSVRGEVSRIRDEDEFILRDETGRIRVYIGWRNDMAVEVGDVVTVHGVADDDVLPFMRPEIYARAITFDDGSVLNLRTARSSRYE